MHPPESTPAFDRNRTAAELRHWAGNNVWFGTSSWKYEGWLGSLYTPDRYQYRGRVAQSRFERDCLAEYASVFKTVCVDAAYYTFPTPKYLSGLAAQVPGDFQFTFKVTDAITVRRFPNLPRFGNRAGEPNDHFLDAALFQEAFLRPLEPHAANVGLLIFEFSRFHAGDFARGRDFVDALDRFLGLLPGSWRYGVEIRNRNFLQPEYFACLERHRVTHVFNAWDAMPPIGEQLDLAGAWQAPFFAARLLLRPGRSYEAAVSQFQPYDRLREPCPEAREAAIRLVKQSVEARDRRAAYVYVNNRLEGNALETIAAIIAGLQDSRP